MKTFINLLLITTVAGCSTTDNSQIQLTQHGANARTCIEGFNAPGPPDLPDKVTCDSKITCDAAEICAYIAEDDPFGFCVPPTLTPMDKFSNNRSQIYLCGQVPTDMGYTNPPLDMTAD